MARGIRTSASELKMKASKAEIEARSQAEELVVNNATKPKALPTLSTAERKIFNKLKKRNDNFTESDSESLNMLCQYLNMWARLKASYDTLSITDDKATELEKRMIAIDKQIAVHMSSLCMPLSQRFRLANDMAKVMIEEKKLQQMNDNNATTQVNPLLAVLEATKE